jgi:tetratricopeptide (TPR) repeat protein
MSDSKAVFALRKAGEIEKALELARTLMDQTPEDTWLIRAYGWSLYDAVKRAEKSKNRPKALELMVEFNRLQIPEDDELLLKQRGHYQITLLGSETHLAEALRRARQKLRVSPNDTEVAKDYAWILCDGVTHALNIRNGELAGKLAEELQALSSRIPAEEEVLHKKISWCIEGDSLISKARKASREGHTPESLELFRRAYQENRSSEAATGLGWELYKTLKGCKTDDAKSTQQATSLILEYVALEQECIEKPSLLHSLMVGQMARFAEFNPVHVPCLRACGGDAFRDEDFERYQPPGGNKDFDGLVEKVLRSVYHAVNEWTPSSVRSVAANDTALRMTQDDAQWAAALFGRYYERFPNQEWFPYYYGKLLLKTDQPSAAREHIVSVVRRKRNEFWAWDNLADTYGEGHEEEKIDCLCRALTCRVQDRSFLVNVHTSLVPLLRKTGLYREARTELDLAIQIRSQKQWSLRSLCGYLAEDWYQQTEPLPSNEALYSKRGPRADLLLYDSEDWKTAVITGATQASKGRETLVFVGYMVGNELKEVPVRERDFPGIAELDKGSPVSVIIDEGRGRDVVVCLKQREGSEWDAIPSQVGVVKNINEAKGVAAVALSRKQICLVHRDQFPLVEELETGDVLGVRTRLNKRRLLVPLTVGRSSSMPPADLVKEFAGELNVLDGGRFGFVHDIYIPKALLADERLSDGAMVAGKALCEWNNKKNCFSWSALTVAPGQE